MAEVFSYLPSQVNVGPFLTSYTICELEAQIQHVPVVLPICSLGTPYDQLGQLAPLVLPPLYHEVLDSTLKAELLDRIRSCFPYYEGTRKRRTFAGQFEIVELPPARIPAPVAKPESVFAFSVDTAVEEHGPHLPLATDTIQSYAVLEQLAGQGSNLIIGPPVDYGHLTWGLPFGLSVDITPTLLTRYVASFVNAVIEWAGPAAVYVVDVHGSAVHRGAIQAGLAQSDCARWAFRWLHEPLVEFAADRGDQHAGGVETALIHRINPELVDPRWWPDRLDEIARSELSFAKAVELTDDLPAFIEHVEAGQFNGIVGRIRNFFDVDAQLMFARMIETARADLLRLEVTR